MCCRFYVDEEEKEELEALPGIKVSGGAVFKRGDVNPGGAAPVIFSSGETLTVDMMRFGFRVRPAGEAKDKLLINARAETVLERRTFSSAAASSRCIVPARLFYEWNSRREKSEFRLSGKSSPLLYMAGIWQSTDAGPEFVIITTMANESMAPVHDRMPLVLPEDRIGMWILKNDKTRELLKTEPAPLFRTSEYEQLSLF
ncbi:MAG: SOS response-associated peptidase [Lachnospiraceae bacterium]|jgi:putative SOS response-associated peptidase YedK